MTLSTVAMLVALALPAAASGRVIRTSGNHTDDSTLRRTVQVYVIEDDDGTRYVEVFRTAFDGDTASTVHRRTREIPEYTYDWPRP